MDAMRDMGVEALRISPQSRTRPRCWTSSAAASTGARHGNRAQ
ncbi:MAG: hypothetical protein M5R42_21035 [Rhodocyclaceae bacterium]|nr:hypothetical protein [Rhodocyclaceae bacterium]